MVYLLVLLLLLLLLLLRCYCFGVRESGVEATASSPSRITNLFYGLRVWFLMRQSYLCGGSAHDHLHHAMLLYLTSRKRLLRSVYHGMM